MKIHATALALVTVTLAGCGHVGQGEYETGMANIRSEMDGRFQELESADAETRDRLGMLESRVALTEEELGELRNEMARMEDEFGMRFEQLEQAMVVGVPVYFGFDQATVRPEGVQALSHFTRLVEKWYPGARITVEGFTDSVGPADYNQALGLRRAEAVERELVALGLADGQLRAVSYGENTDRLVLPNAAGPGSEGWQNRRVTLVVDHAPTATTAPDGAEVTERTEDSRR